MQPSDLRRHLHDAGSTYAELVARVRMEAARRVLEDPSLHVYEIAAGTVDSSVPPGV